MQLRLLGQITLIGALTLGITACPGGGGGYAAPAPPPPVTGKIFGTVNDAATGSGISGVQVAVGNLSTTTDATGGYALISPTPASSLIVTFAKTGYVPQSRTTAAYTTASSVVLLNVPMLAVALTQAFDPATAQTFSVPSSTAQVQLAANALRTAAGGVPSGQATALVTPISSASNLGVMPGNYLSAPASGGTAPIESFGALDVRFTDAAGNALNLAAGQTATLRIPLSTRSSTPPASIPLFFFDTSTGLWKQEGTATLQGTAPNQFYQGTVAHFTAWNADQVETTITVTSCVKDTAGALVAGATVTSEGEDYSGSSSTVTDASGNFTVAMKSGGTGFILAVKDTRLSNSRKLAPPETNANVSQTNCLVLTQAAISVKLTWGSAPLDLDSHTLGANSSDHVYFLSQGSLTALPYVSLDVDDTNGFGPEVTTFAKVAKSRKYRFYVHNYSATFNPGMTGSPARVELTINGNQTVFIPPAGETASTFWWQVFDLTSDAYCQVTVTPVQQFVATEPTNPNTDNNAGFCN